MSGLLTIQFNNKLFKCVLQIVSSFLFSVVFQNCFFNVGTNKQILILLLNLQLGNFNGVMILIDVLGSLFSFMCFIDFFIKDQKIMCTIHLDAHKVLQVDFQLTNIHNYWKWMRVSLTKKIHMKKKIINMWLVLPWANKYKMFQTHPNHISPMPSIPLQNTSPKTKLE
jgi:hypothetical protein